MGSRDPSICGKIEIGSSCFIVNLPHSRAAQLPVRKLRILHAIVETYLNTGEPVSSSSIAGGRFVGDAPSPATIRNTMSELVEFGLLTQPHTSAGRIPTPPAIQSYVSSLKQIRPNPVEVSKLQRKLLPHGTWPGRIEEGSHVLTDITHNIAITAALPPESQILHQVELLHVGPRQYLMVVITSDRTVHNQVLTLQHDISSAELIEIRNYINLEFSGQSLAEARRLLEERLQTERGQYDALLRRIELFYTNGLFDIAGGPRVFLDGAAYLIGLDLHLTKERMRELFRALEQKQHILQMLDQFLQSSGRDSGGPHHQPSVKVGLGDAHPALHDFSIVGIEVALPGGMSARIAVLGPLRLNYPRTIAAVLEMGQALSQSGQ